MDISTYIANHDNHAQGLQLLHDIITDTGLQPTIKWGAPVYVLGKKNIVGMGAFKAYFGLWFFQGGLLKDHSKVLVNAQEKTKALRQWRFKYVSEIDANLVKSYILEAIANQEAGREIKPEKKELIIPIELDEALSTDADLEAAFEKLSHSCKREYAEYISEAKKAATKARRLEKITEMILQGNGLHDKYRNC